MWLQQGNLQTSATFPYTHTYTYFSKYRCVYLSIQALLQIILSTGSIQSCFLYKCNVSVKLVIMKVSIIKSELRRRCMIFAIWISLKERRNFLMTILTIQRIFLCNAKQKHTNIQREKILNAQRCTVGDIHKVHKQS